VILERPHRAAKGLLVVHQNPKSKGPRSMVLVL
jgi:hypothetical protein